MQITVALTLLGSLSPAENDCAFWLFRECINCLVKSKWMTFPILLNHYWILIH